MEIRRILLVMLFLAMPAFAALTANVTIAPRYVDTGVVNQSFVLSIVPTGSDSLKSVIVQVPPILSNLNLSYISIGNSNDTTFNENRTIGNYLNITAVTPTINRIEVYFTANTSSSSGTGIFNTTLYGSGFSNISADPVNNNLTVQPILNITTLISKSTAILNGTDFWEFNFTINASANVTGGLIQFRMTNWTNSEGGNLNILNSGCPSSVCATLRNDSNFTASSGKINVGFDLSNATLGIPIGPLDPSGMVNLVLRMVIPSGTGVSSTWQSSYGFLFRSYA